MTLNERARRDLEDAGTVLRTPEGARFFSALLELCGVWRLSYNGEETHATAFKEGARNVGLTVLGWLDEASDASRELLAQADKERCVGEWQKIQA